MNKKQKAMTEAQIKATALSMSFLLIVKDFELAKQCALICVEEVMNLDTIKAPVNETSDHVKYWHEVKKEINLL